jgi:uncharacterized protein (DUF305 family)
MRYGAAFISVLLAGLLAAPVAADPGGLDPAPNPGAARIETEFLTQMIPHHRGAVEMAEMALQKAARQEVRQLAQQIIQDQEREISQMSHWLRDWYGLTPPSGTEMDMASMMQMAPMLHGTMPDMTARMHRLMGLSGPEFDVEFLSAMTDHHSMAVMMAAPVLMSGHHADLYALAENVVITQGEEIKRMDEYLDRFYGVRRPLEGPVMMH